MEHVRYNLGLVLGGGGARGFAHMGVAKALYEKGIRPDIISGVSAGAIAGAFLASGLDPEEVMKLLKDQDIMKISRIHLPKDGLLKLDGLKKHLEEHIPYKRLEDLPTPLVIAVCNLNTARVEYLNKGDLSDVILASSSIPILFSPVRMNGSVYVDGGMLDNLPVKPIRKLCSKVYAVNITPIHETDKLDNLIHIAVRSFHMSVDKWTQHWGKKADLLIEPPGVDQYDILRSRHAEELFEIAYNYTKNLI